MQCPFPLWTHGKHFIRTTIMSTYIFRKLRQRNIRQYLRTSQVLWLQWGMCWHKEDAKSMFLSLNLNNNFCASQLIIKLKQGKAHRLRRKLAVHSLVIFPLWFSSFPTYPTDRWLVSHMHILYVCIQLVSVFAPIFMSLTNEAHSLWICLHVTSYSNLFLILSTSFFSWCQAFLCGDLIPRLS